MLDRARGRRIGWSSWLMCLLAVSGCTSPALPAKGKVVFEKGDVGALAGSSVVCQNLDDLKVLAFGDIQDDGSFELWTKWKGGTVEGALRGRYQAWITLNGSTAKEFDKSRIDPMFLNRSSPLTFEIPCRDDLVLTVTRAPQGVQFGDVKDRPSITVRCSCGDVGDEEDNPGSDG